MVNQFFDDFAIRELLVLTLFPMLRIELFVYQESNVYPNFLPYFIDFAPVYIKEFFLEAGIIGKHSHSYTPEKCLIVTFISLSSITYHSSCYLPCKTKYILNSEVNCLLTSFTCFLLSLHVLLGLRQGTGTFKWNADSSLFINRWFHSLSPFIFISVFILCLLDVQIVSASTTRPKISVKIFQTSVCTYKGQCSVLVSQ